jgi:hypothetical protein
MAIPRPQPTRAKILRGLRERHNISIFEANRILMGRELRDQVAQARSIEELKPVLHTLINDRFPDNYE